MHKNNTYFIPYQDKYIIYQPLNRLAFIGNSAMKELIEKLQNGDSVDTNKNNEAIAFLNTYGVFNKYDYDFTKPGNGEYSPTVCVLCMTSDCNFRCSYCFANSGDFEKRELPVEIGKKGIDLVYGNAVRSKSKHFVISFHGGGEPTLPYRKLKVLTEYARTKDIQSIIELTSNGYWNNEKTSWIVSNIDNLTLSFDGAIETQNQQRPLKDGKPTYNIVLNNIQKLDESKVKYGIRLTVTNDSVNSLGKNIEFLCKKTKCTTFQVEPAFEAGRAVTNKQTIKNNKRFMDHFMLAHDISKNYGRHMYYSGARPWVITNRFCTAHDNALVITPEGFLSSCYEISGTEHALSKAFHFGMLSTDGESHIDYEKRNVFSEKIEERKDLCEECFCYWHCAGDCPAKTFSPNDFNNTTFSERCDVNRKITLELILNNINQGDGIWYESNRADK